jgi:hypothetical protein
MRRPPQLGQIARALHENGTRRSNWHALHRTPGEAALELPAPEEIAELALDEARQAASVGGGGGLCQETLQVRAHHLMEHRLRHSARRVDARQHDGTQRMPCRSQPVRPSHHRGCVGGGRRPVRVQPEMQRRVSRHGAGCSRARGVLKTTPDTFFERIETDPGITVLQLDGGVALRARDRVAGGRWELLGDEDEG